LRRQIVDIVKKLGSGPDRRAIDNAAAMLDFPAMTCRRAKFNNSKKAPA